MQRKFDGSFDLQALKTCACTQIRNYKYLSIVQFNEKTLAAYTDHYLMEGRGDMLIANCYLLIAICKLLFAKCYLLNAQFFESSVQ